MKSEYSDNKALIKEVYELALQNVGNDFGSLSLWECLLDFEKDNLRNSLEIYKKILSSPIDHLESVFEGFNKLI